MAQAKAAIDFSVEEKIAVFLASLDEQTAASILQQLEPEMMARLVTAIGELGVVPGAVREEVVNGCLGEISELGQAVFGDAKVANALLIKAIGEKRASALLMDDTVRKELPFADLRQVDPVELADALSKEQAVVSALVLRYLPPNMAADVLSKFPQELRKQVMVNIASSTITPSDDVINGMEELLKAKLLHSRSKKNVAAVAKDKVDVMAGILQHVETAMEEELMAVIEDHSKELSAQLRDRLFTFEDIVNLNDIVVRRILQEIDTGTLSLGLRNASVALKNKFFNNMSKRAAEGIKEDMANSPKVRLAEIDAKQREIVNIIRALESQGQITIARGEEDVFV